MKHFSKAFLYCICLLLIACGGDDGGSGADSGGTGGTLPDKGSSRTLAFPGADGCGSRTITGGAGKSVYIVTNLNDDGEGSLRFGLKNGNRTIVFAVGGQINLLSNLEIKASDITVAGQTAPGGGITIAGYPVYISNNARNIILRFLRFRLGDQNVDKPNFVANDGDALGAKDCSNILIDHCSMSYSTDECASFTRINNFTMQYCIISESLKLSGHTKGNHGYGGIWGGKNVSYHHNLLAHHDSRNPRFDHNYVGNVTAYGPIDYINNVVYNWGGNSAYGGEAAAVDFLFHINMVNNYYKPGNNSNAKNRLLELTSMCDGCYKWGSQQGKAVRSKQHECYLGKYYIAGNNVNGTANKDWEAVDTRVNYSFNNISYTDSRTPEEIKNQANQSTRYATGLTELKLMESAENAYNSVLTYAGASKVRDAVDKRIVNDVKNGTGAIIDKVSDKMEDYYPTLSPGTPITDTDKDGMPDDWEMAEIAKLGVKVGIDAFQPSAYNITGHYTNLEVYMNELVSGTFPSGANATDTR